MKTLANFMNPFPAELALESKSVKVDEKTGDLTFEAIALDTKKKPNRKGFTFKWASAADVDVSPLQENGRLYFMHDTWEIGVGFITQVKVTKSRVTIKGLIPGDSRFSEEMQDSDLVKQIREVREAVRTGLLKAVSVGFYINAYNELRDPKTQELIGLQVTQLEIIEVSVVTIGAHETALIQSAPGVVCDDDLSWAEDQFEEADVLCEQSLSRNGELVNMSVEENGRDRKQAPTADEILSMIQAEDKTSEPTEYDAKALSALRQRMAKALGARGCEASEEEYTEAAQGYSEAGLTAPEFKADYTSEALKEMHEQGAIEIPGAAKKDQAAPVAVVEIDGKGLEPAVDEMREVCEKFGDLLERAERLVNERGELKAGTKEASPQEAAPLDTEALRAEVRAVLQSKEFEVNRKALAQAYVAQKAEENKRRIQRVRRA
jgi:hypothetical protein